MGKTKVETVRAFQKSGPISGSGSLRKTMSTRLKQFGKKYPLISTGLVLIFGYILGSLNPLLTDFWKGFLIFSKKPREKIKSRQDAPVVYQLNGLFTINVDKFLKYGKTCMPKILPYEIPPETGFMIDTEFEFQTAELIAKGKIKIPH